MATVATDEEVRVATEIGLGVNEPGKWRESFRRLNDGITIRTSPASVRGWVNVSIVGPSGYYLCQTTIPIDEAFAEIPFCLDRARLYDRLLGEQNG